MHLRAHDTYALICVMSGKVHETSHFSGIQRVEEEAMAMDSRVVGRVCKINALELKRQWRIIAYLGRLDLTGAWVVTVTSYKEQCFPSLLSQVYSSGEVSNVPHLLVFQKRSQKPSGECRKERAHTSNLTQEARAASGEAVAPCLLLVQPRNDLLLLRVVSLLASTNFTFVWEAI